MLKMYIKTMIKRNLVIVMKFNVNSYESIHVVKQLTFVSYLLSIDACHTPAARLVFDIARE